MMMMVVVVVVLNVLVSPNPNPLNLPNVDPRLINPLSLKALILRSRKLYHY